MTDMIAIWADHRKLLFPEDDNDEIWHMAAECYDALVLAQERIEKLGRVAQEYQTLIADLEEATGNNTAWEMFPNMTWAMLRAVVKGHSLLAALEDE